MSIFTVWLLIAFNTGIHSPTVVVKGYNSKEACEKTVGAIHEQIGRGTGRIFICVPAEGIKDQNE